MLIQFKNNIKIKRKFPLLVSSLVVAVSLVLTPQALAETLSISGNGSESKSEIKVDSSSNVNANQTNNADVNNDVDVNQNTGNNEASKNTDGSSSINTGNANSDISLSNSTNVSSVNISNCDNCGGDGHISISGNGAFSDNKIDFDSSSNNRVNVYQNADIRNNVDLDAITGRNEANLNTDGDVSIDTGDIRSRENILNRLLNFSEISIAGSPFHDFLVKIFGNGAFSDNEVKTDLDSDNDVHVKNKLDVVNDLKQRYVTGENEANKNTDGDVDVRTGDIDVEKNILNEGNISKVEITCECEVSPTPVPSQPQPTLTPSAPTPTAEAPTPTSVPAGAVSPTPQPEQVLGAAAILPVTGNNWFFLAMLGNVLMLIMGAYLRLRSGRSPGVSI